MSIDAKAAISRIDDVFLECFDIVMGGKLDVRGLHEKHPTQMNWNGRVTQALPLPSYRKMITILESALLDLTPPRHVIREEMDGMDDDDGGEETRKRVESLAGMLSGLRYDYAHGFLHTFTGLIDAQVFSDYFEMSEHLLSEGYKDAAAVISGSALEHHLRELARRNQLLFLTAGGAPIKAGALNETLGKSGAYSLTDQKNVTAWLGLRNCAAHGEYERVSRGQVEIMLAGIREFVARVPL